MASVAAAVAEFYALGIELEKQSFRTSWDIPGQSLQGLRLKLKAFALTFRDLARHVCQKITLMAS